MLDRIGFGIAVMSIHETSRNETQQSLLQDVRDLVNGHGGLLGMVYNLFNINHSRLTVGVNSAHFDPLTISCQGL